MNKHSVILIGMPGAGKSTVGVLLAKRLAKAFIDTDILIQQTAGMTLQDYLDANGYLALRTLEEQVLMTEPMQQAVVSTGGSAVYSDAAMARLAEIGPRVFLDISLATMEQRIHNQASRGLASQPGVSLAAIYAERYPLYQQYADVSVVADQGSVDDVVECIVERVAPLLAY